MAEAWELESATPGPVWPWGVTGATCISTTLYCTSDGTTTGQADRPISAVPISGLLRFYLETDSLAFNVFEFPEGLLGDIDGILDGADQEGRSIERLLGANSAKQ